MTEKTNPQKPSFLQVVLSVFAAAIGVQNKKNLEKDFSQTSPLPFIVAGVTFTVVFVLILVAIVQAII